MIEQPSSGIRKLSAIAGIAAAFAALGAGCRSTSQTAAEPSIVASHNDFADPVVHKDVNQLFRHGERFEMTIDPSRELDQVTVVWDVDYSLVMRDASGHVMLNDEGQPMYRDGMYAYPKVKTAQGAVQQIGPKKFVAANETDNIHDIQGVRGSTLFVEFWHARDQQDNPQVRAARRAVKLISVTLRYKDAPGQQYKDYIYNPNYDDSLSSLARYVPAGQTFELPIPANLRVYRVDVRWGDAKPRVNGVYVPGTATGRVKFNGAWQGEARNVAAIETQTWAGLQYPPAEGGSHTLVVSFRNDGGRIHSVRVYYQ